ncbi:MAG: flavin reductase family protein [Proteobacteria bacterium]|nr:flavin reductase family protein [Pseudomonadota bacterium]
MSIESIDPRAFRDAMGCFASAVTIVSTTTKQGQAIGMTVNSFNSVSLDPPLILFCLGREATNYEHFLAAGRFAVNILRRDQDQISTGFARAGANFFQTLAHKVSSMGNPLVPNALAIFDCQTEAIHDGGDHVILIGRVNELRHDPDGDPLVYYRGRYSGVSPET